MANELPAQYDFYDVGYDKLLNRGTLLDGADITLADSSSVSSGTSLGDGIGSESVSSGSTNGEIIISDSNTNLVEDQVAIEDIASGETNQSWRVGEYGHLVGGATDYNSGIGWWLGYRITNEDYAFFVGDSTGDKMTYNPTDGLDVTGTITASTFIGGSIHIPDQDSTAASFHTNSSGNSWWGCTETNFTADNDNANAYVLADGSGKFQNITITGTSNIELGSGSSILKGNSSDGIWLGDATFASAVFSVALDGTLKATLGTIGGWTIGASSLTDTAGTVGLSSAVTGGDDIRIWAGNVTPASAPFYVTEAGVLSASSGTVGGWTLGATTLTGGNTSLTNTGIITVGTGDDVAILSSADATWRLWIGDATNTDAPFRVDKDGNLVASAATITGSITADTGYIGGTSGWVISANYLKDAAGLVGLSSVVTVGDDIRFWAGHVTPASAPFYVTEAGVLVATSATISGSITATTGAIGGWNIVSGYLYSLASGTPTSTPNDGIVMASTNPVLSVYEDTAKRVEFGYLSAGVFGLKGYDTGGSNVIFELSDTQQKIGGWYFTDTVLRSATTDAASAIFIDSANGLIRAGATTGDYLTLDGANLRLRSSNYVSGFAGAGFTLEPDLLEVGNIACRGLLRTYVLEKDIISVNAGSLVVAPNADVLDTDMTALDASTLTTKGTTTFAVGDILRIKDGTDDEWMTVTDISSAPTYVVTRDEASVYGADSNPTWKAGASVVNYGQSGDGGLYLTASDTNNPYLSVFTHAGSPWSALTTQLRIGNLNGYLGYVADTYGFGVGSSSGTNANITIDPTNGIRMRSGTTDLITLDNSGNAAFSGSITATSGAIGGWTIGATSLTDTAGLVGLSSAVTGGDDIRIWAGHVTPASAPFYVTEAGVLYASSATITGAITADTGYIGGATGWVISTNYIKDVAGVTGLSSAVTGGDDIRIWAGNATPSSAPFYVTEAGVLVASSATITGAITATSGAIGGWTINATSIYTGTEDHSGYTANAGDITIYSDGSNASIHANKFYIDSSGVLNATDGVFAGEITATSGAIGGFNIGSDYIRDVANTFGLASTVTGGDDIRFWAGSAFADRASAPFRVTEAGKSVTTNFVSLIKEPYFQGSAGDTFTTTLDGGTSITRSVAETNIRTSGSANTCAALHLANTAFTVTYGSGAFDFDNDFYFSSQVNWSQDITTLADSVGFIGIGLRTEMGTPDLSSTITETNYHVGFIQVGGTLYASNANGTNQTYTDISAGVTLTQYNAYSIEYDAATSIKFYVNGTPKATHTTNIPSGGDSEWDMGFAMKTTTATAKNMIVANNYQLYMST